MAHRTKAAFVTLAGTLLIGAADAPPPTPAPPIPNAGTVAPSAETVAAIDAYAKALDGAVAPGRWTGTFTEHDAGEDGAPGKDEIESIDECVGANAPAEFLKPYPAVLAGIANAGVCTVTPGAAGSLDTAMTCNVGNGAAVLRATSAGFAKADQVEVAMDIGVETVAPKAATLTTRVKRVGNCKPEEKKS